MPFVSGGSGGSSRVFAQVTYNGAQIDDWDGSTLAFATVDHDPGGLWDAANHQFLAKAAGWYRVAFYPSSTNGGVGVAAAATVASLALYVVVFGAGNNLAVRANQQNAASGGRWWFPPIAGTTNLGIGDSCVVQGDGGTGWRVVPPVTFSLELVG